MEFTERQAVMALGYEVFAANISFFIPRSVPYTSKV